MAVCMIGKVVLLGRGLVALRRIDQRAALRRAVGIEPGSKPRNARRLGRIAIRKLDEIGLFLDLGGRRRLRCDIRRSARRCARTRRGRLLLGKGFGLLGPAGNKQRARKEERRTAIRSEERRGGKECGSTCRSRGWPSHKKNKKQK